MQWLPPDTKICTESRKCAADLELQKLSHIPKAASWSGVLRHSRENEVEAAAQTNPGRVFRLSTRGDRTRTARAIMSSVESELKSLQPVSLLPSRCLPHRAAEAAQG